MNKEKIITLQEIDSTIKKLQEENKKIVLIGGCFDVLHIGHIDFIKKARLLGDVLVILLESDGSIIKLKGSSRPIYRQIDRATVLAALEAVDVVVKLPTMTDDTEYDNVISKIKPAIIATTIGDSYKLHKERQAESVKAKLIEIAKITNQSTSKVAQLLEREI